MNTDSLHLMNILYLYSILYKWYMYCTCKCFPFSVWNWLGWQYYFFFSTTRRWRKWWSFCSFPLLLVRKHTWHMVWWHTSALPLHAWKIMSPCKIIMLTCDLYMSTCNIICQFGDGCSSVMEETLVPTHSEWWNKATILYMEYVI